MELFIYHYIVSSYGLYKSILFAVLFFSPGIANILFNEV